MISLRILNFHKMQVLIYELKKITLVHLRITILHYNRMNITIIKSTTFIRLHEFFSYQICAI